MSKGKVERKIFVPLPPLTFYSSFLLSSFFFPSSFLLLLLNQQVSDVGIIKFKSSGKFFSSSFGQLFSCFFFC